MGFNTDITSTTRIGDSLIDADQYSTYAYKVDHDRQVANNDNRSTEPSPNGLGEVPRVKPKKLTSDPKKQPRKSSVPARKKEQTALEKARDKDLRDRNLK